MYKYEHKTSRHKLLKMKSCCTTSFVPCTADLRRQLVRHGAPYRDPTYFPQKTVYAMRMLAGVKDHRTRISLSHDLYKVSVGVYIHIKYIL